MFSTIILPSVLGFVIFLCGMKLIEMTLYKLGGSSLNHWLIHATKTPLHGLISGTITTAFLQSSTAVTALSISLVNARIITFSRTLGIILGTNIGTCLTTELIGLNIFHWYKPILFSAMIIWMISSIALSSLLKPIIPFGKEIAILRSSSIILFGFGLLLAGISMMQSIGPYLQQTSLYISFVEQAQTTLLWGVVIGAVLTALFHSSAAVIAMIMGIAAIDTLPLELCIAMVIGSNVGTCATAIIASISGSRGGQFVALSHLVLNVGGAILFYPFISLLADAVLLTTSSIPTAIAHSQTMFNMICSIIALPICYLSWFKRLDQV